MKTYQVSTSNAEQCRALGRDPNFIPGMLYPGDPNGHKFKPGDTCTLVGLVDYPEFNGQTVKIEGIREDGAFGRAYYVEGAINSCVNWVYEYRLEPTP